MDFREKMHSGALYQCMDESILVEQFQCLDKLYEYNQTRPSQQAERTALLKEMLAEAASGLAGASAARAGRVKLVVRMAQEIPVTMRVNVVFIVFCLLFCFIWFTGKRIP